MADGSSTKTRSGWRYAHRVLGSAVALGALLDAGDADWVVWGMTASTAGRLARDRSGGLRWK